MKSDQIRRSLWSVFSCIWTEYGKIRTRNTSFSVKFFPWWVLKHETISTKKFSFLIVTLWTRNTSVFGHFSRSVIVKIHEWTGEKNWNDSGRMVNSLPGRGDGIMDVIYVMVFFIIVNFQLPFRLVISLLEVTLIY